MMQSDTGSELSDSSVYEALSRSERIVNGSVVLDWRKLPAELLSALPDLPQSARKLHKNTHRDSTRQKHNVPVNHTHHLCEKHQLDHIKQCQEEQIPTKGCDSSTQPKLNESGHQSTNHANDEHKMSNGKSHGSRSPIRGRNRTRISSKSPQHLHHKQHSDDLLWEDIDASPSPIESKPCDASAYLDHVHPQAAIDSLTRTNDLQSQPQPLTFNNCRFTYLRPDQVFENEAKEHTMPKSDSQFKDTKPQLELPILSTVAHSSIPIEIKATSIQPAYDSGSAPELAQLFRTLELLNQQHLPQHQEASALPDLFPSRSMAQSPLKSSIRKETRFGLDQTSIMSLAELSQDMPDSPAGISTYCNTELQGTASKPFCHDNLGEQPSKFMGSATSNESAAICTQKQVLTKVHAELSSLTKELHKRIAKVTERELYIKSQELNWKSKELDLTNRELAFVARDKQMRIQENRIEKEVQTLVEQRIASQNDAIQQNAKSIVKQYGDMLEQSNKENKRLQTSLRDMVTANRLLRDQNKQLLLEKNDAEQRLEHQTVILKQSKDRVERLKKTLACAQSNMSMSSKTTKNKNVKDGLLLETDMLQQMQKIIMRQPIKVSVETQTGSFEQTQSIQGSTPSSLSQTQMNGPRHAVLNEELPLGGIALLVQVLLKLVSLHDIRSVDALTDADIPDAMYFEAITSSFAIVDGSIFQFKVDKAENKDADWDQRGIVMQVINLYLEFVLRFLRRPTCLRAQKHTVTSLVYQSFVEMAGPPASFMSFREEKARVLTYLIVLSGVSQADVLEVMLDGLLSELLNNPGCKAAFVESNGTQTVMFILSNFAMQPRLAFLSSEILFLMSAASGALQDKFFMQCSQPDMLDALAESVEGIDYVVAMENASALMQKLSRSSEYRNRMRSSPRLMNVLRKLMETHNPEGTGEADMRLTEFASANVRSVLHHLDTVE
ncbi:hypothetical protein QVD99_002674 [Batrachochytrium dendrobatidis]|nr:hypothetical protein QVD99_002674 [Batrachochytrium dendrobatidis]